MKKILTSNSNFYILVDKFPYKDSISKLETEFASWFDFKTKQKKDIFQKGARKKDNKK